MNIIGGHAVKNITFTRSYSTPITKHCTELVGTHRIYTWQPHQVRDVQSVFTFPAWRYAQWSHPRHLQPTVNTVIKNSRLIYKQCLSQDYSCCFNTTLKIIEFSLQSPQLLRYKQTLYQNIWKLAAKEISPPVNIYDNKVNAQIPYLPLLDQNYPRYRIDFHFISKLSNYLL